MGIVQSAPTLQRSDLGRERTEGAGANGDDTGGVRGSVCGWRRQVGRPC